MGETIRIQVEGGEMSAYLARPAAARAPAVVVLQEIFGVNAVMRDITDGLAAQGFLAVYPDLFWRIEPEIDITDRTEAEWKKAFALMNAFDASQGVKDIAATLDHIRAEPGCNGKAGAVGFCLGGQLAWLTATRTDADAAVSYYGVGIEGLFSSTVLSLVLAPVAYEQLAHGVRRLRILRGRAGSRTDPVTEAA